MRAYDDWTGRGGAGILGVTPARWALALMALILAVALVVAGGIEFPGSGIWTSEDGRQSEAQAREAFTKLPLTFERNDGQAPEGVDFVARGANYTLFLEGGNAALALAGGKLVNMELVGAGEAARAAGRDQLPGVVNYLGGSDASNWNTNIPTYRTVAYEGVYPGIDVVYYGRKGMLEYDFVVAPGAEAADIALRFVGADSLSISRSGELLVGTSAGTIRQSKPVLYQEIDGRRRAVSGRFERRSGHEVGFSVGRYDRSRPLVIDPTLSYGTYVGSNSFDITFGIAVDRRGHAYAVGHTQSVNFPTKGGVECATPDPAPTPPPSPTTSFQCDQAGPDDAFIQVLNPEGTALEWATYLGGRYLDQAWDVAVDRAGNAYIVGATNSYDDIATTDVNEAFPTTSSAFDRTCGTDGVCNGLFGNDGLSDVFMAKLSADGSQLLYSSLIGGSDFDQENLVTALPSEMDIAVRGSKAYIVGQTGSADFPTTAGAFDRHCGRKEAVPICDDGEKDGFLAVFNTTKSRKASLLLSTYVGGSGGEEGRGVGVDNAGNVYVAGTTTGFNQDPNDDESPVINNLKTKSARFANYRGGESDAFVMKINPRKTGKEQLVYSTYIGGGGRDQAWGLAVKSGNTRRTRGKGAVFLTGFTDSGNAPETPEQDPFKPYFPTTRGSFDRTYGGRTTTGAFDESQFLNGDGYLLKLKPSGKEIAYSGFIGGEFHDVATDVAVDRTGRAYVTGYMTCLMPQDGTGPQAPPCNADDFPVTADAPWAQMDGRWISHGHHNIPTDSFAVAISKDGSSFFFATFLPGKSFERGFGVAVRDRNSAGDPIEPETYYVGRTNSNTADNGFPPVNETASPAQPEHGGGGREGYVIKLIN